MEQILLNDYCFTWGADHEHAALALGFGSIYNHCYQPNAAYIKRLPEQVIDFVALRAIAQGEEISINYIGTAKGRAPMWFGQVM
ncbi:MAG: SET domain-containing protein-lysine N-methyltransferase [Candidatus Handelsmanbacteria bacterium]|nr:SET domain-containing protein-lysine N-methyltransferase [Candidatus Handelsmanbacteria bacterium]